MPPTKYNRIIKGRVLRVGKTCTRVSVWLLTISYMNLGKSYKRPYALVSLAVKLGW